VKLNYRYIILAFFIIIFSIFSMRHFVLGGDQAASIDALCPFGGFETLYTFIATGGFVPRILISSLVLAGALLLTVVVLRKGFCGYICPFGAAQELIGKLRKKKIAEHDTDNSRYLKYGILAAILIGTAVTGSLVFREYDPFVTLFHFGKGVFWDIEPGHLGAFLITVAVLGMSIFAGRFWCKHLCPLAAIMNIFAFLSFTKITRNTKTCIDCGICDKNCQMNINVSEPKEVRSLECINCNECVRSCPKNSLQIEVFKKPVSAYAYVGLLMLLFFGSIGVAKAVGVWNSVPGTELESLDGELLADNIKGWMTIADISAESGIDESIILKEVGLPPGLDTSIPINRIGDEIGREFHAEQVRDFIEHYGEVRLGPSCPWNIQDDPAPGLCGLYVDSNNDGLCDLSE